MGQQVNLFSKLWGEAKATFKKGELNKLDPKLTELIMAKLKVIEIYYWRTAAVYVEKYWSELWLGVKGLSKLVIAGFLR